MSFLAQLETSYAESFMLGLFYGLTFCTSSCLPYITSYIAGIKAGFKKGVIVTLIYNFGREMAYITLGVLADFFKQFISDVSFFDYQKYALTSFGVTLIAVGISILHNKPASSHLCITMQTQFNATKKIANIFDIRAFLMGFTKGLIVCPPFMALLLYSVTLSASSSSFVLATMFGLGTILSPLIIFCGVTGWLLSKAPLYSRWVIKISAGILILSGLNMILNAVFQT
ncbi:MAG: sulfite exporter TauE/SafE family protein [Candidatus Jordarchaeaceae archaeon]